MPCVVALESPFTCPLRKDTDGLELPTIAATTSCSGTALSRSYSLCSGSCVLISISMAVFAALPFFKFPGWTFTLYLCCMIAEYGAHIGRQKCRMSSSLGRPVREFMISTSPSCVSC